MTTNMANLPYQQGLSRGSLLVLHREQVGPMENLTRTIVAQNGIITRNEIIAQVIKTTTSQTMWRLPDIKATPLARSPDLTAAGQSSCIMTTTTTITTTMTELSMWIDIITTIAVPVGYSLARPVMAGPITTGLRTALDTSMLTP